ncbi:MAG: hypothetical protein MI799_12920, partial [Desulfobacterales bacterium]|nr:hypothetical protein [Desulfobacterales bacterium]
SLLRSEGAWLRELDSGSNDELCVMGEDGHEEGVQVMRIIREVSIKKRNREGRRRIAGVVEGLDMIQSTKTGCPIASGWLVENGEARFTGEGWSVIGGGVVDEIDGAKMMLWDSCCEGGDVFSFVEGRDDQIDRLVSLWCVHNDANGFNVLYDRLSDGSMVGSQVNCSYSGYIFSGRIEELKKEACLMVWRFQAIISSSGLLDELEIAADFRYVGQLESRWKVNL